MLLQLEILTPSGPVLTTEVAEVTLPGVQGELGILPGHAALLAALKPGVLTYRTDQRQGQVAIADGCVEVGPEDHVLVLVKTAALPETIVLAQARQEATRLRVQLEGWAEPLFDADGNPSANYVALQQALAWAEAQVCIAATNAKDPPRTN